MSRRITDPSALQGARQQILGMENYLKTTGLDVNLLDLVRTRVSQINGCAFCLSMHIQELLEHGEREDRIAVLSAWREAPWFSEREQAALAWAEAVTTLENREVPDAVFEQARSQFSEQELGDLILAVIAINSWNRMNVAFRTPPRPFTIDHAPASEEVAAAH